MPEIGSVQLRLIGVIPLFVSAMEGLVKLLFEHCKVVQGSRAGEGIGHHGISWRVGAQRKGREGWKVGRDPMARPELNFSGPTRRKSLLFSHSSGGSLSSPLGRNFRFSCCFWLARGVDAESMTGPSFSPGLPASRCLEASGRRGLPPILEAGFAVAALRFAAAIAPAHAGWRGSPGLKRASWQAARFGGGAGGQAVAWQMQSA